MFSLLDAGKHVVKINNYFITDREVLSLMVIVRNLHVNMGAHVVVFSDHESFQNIAKMVNHNTRLLRWALELTNYDIKVQRIKGSEITIDDILSRPNHSIPRDNSPSSLERCSQDF